MLQDFARSSKLSGTMTVLANNLDRNGRAFVSVVEGSDGLPIWATQFHPEKSGDAGAYILENWLATLR